MVSLLLNALRIALKRCEFHSGDYSFGNPHAENYEAAANVLQDMLITHNKRPEEQAEQKII